MRFFKTYLKVVTDPNFMRIDAKLRGHWYALLAHCAEKENGGVIQGAGDYTASDWLRCGGFVRTTLPRLRDVGLVAWDGDDLVVNYYDLDGERAVRKASVSGLKGAELRWKGHRDPKGDPNRDPSKDPNGDLFRGANGVPYSQEENKGEEKREDAPAGFDTLSKPDQKILNTHHTLVHDLWDLQTKLRAWAIKNTRGLEPSAERLLRVAKRLAAGASKEDCEHVLRVYAAEAKANPESAQWFNGVTNWRTESFEQSLGRPAPRIAPATPGPVIHPDDESPPP